MDRKHDCLSLADFHTRSTAEMMEYDELLQSKKMRRQHQRFLDANKRGFDWQVEMAEGLQLNWDGTKPARPRDTSKIRGLNLDAMERECLWMKPELDLMLNLDGTKQEYARDVSKLHKRPVKSCLKLDAKEKEAAVKVKENMELSASVKYLKSENSRLWTQNRDLKLNLDGIRQEHARDVSKLQEKIVGSGLELEGKEKEVAEKARENMELTATVEKWVAENSQLRAQNKNQKLKFDGIQFAHARVESKLQAKIDELGCKLEVEEKQVADLEARLEAEMPRIDASRLETLEGSRKLEQAERTISDLEVKLDVKEKQVADLEARLKAEMPRIEASRLETLEVSRELEQTKRTISDLEVKLKFTETQVANLEAWLKAAMPRLVALRLETPKGSHKFEQADSTISDLKEVFEALTGEKLESEVESNRLKQEYEEHKERSATTTERSIDDSEELDDVKSSPSHPEQKPDALQDEEAASTLENPADECETTEKRSLPSTEHDPTKSNLSHGPLAVVEDDDWSVVEDDDWSA